MDFAAAETRRTTKLIPVRPAHGLARGFVTWPATASGGLNGIHGDLADWDTERSTGCTSMTGDNEFAVRCGPVLIAPSLIDRHVPVGSGPEAGRESGSGGRTIRSPIRNLSAAPFSVGLSLRTRGSGRPVPRANPRSPRFGFLSF